MLVRTVVVAVRTVMVVVAVAAGRSWIAAV